jgi:hypothetical protein
MTLLLTFYNNISYRLMTVMCSLEKRAAGGPNRE